MKPNFSIKSFAIATMMGFGVIAPSFADDTPLAKEMETVSDSLKGLRKAETTEDKVALAQAAQAATLKSLEYLPMIFKDVNDAKEKAKSTADYKRLVGTTYATLCELEIAFMEGDDAKADEILDKLKDLKKEGHKKYTE